MAGIKIISTIFWEELSNKLLNRYLRGNKIMVVYNSGNKNTTNICLMRILGINACITQAYAKSWVHFYFGKWIKISTFSIKYPYKLSLSTRKIFIYEKSLVFALFRCRIFGNK